MNSKIRGVEFAVIFSVLRIFRFQIFCVKWLAIEEPNYYAVHNVSIAHDDEQIEAHKIWLRKQSKCGFWHPATDSGILLQIQTSCYRCRIPATDSSIPQHIQASCYRFRHLATDSGILLQIQAFCYRFRHLATDSGILLQIQAS